MVCVWLGLDGRGLVRDWGVFMGGGGSENCFVLGWLSGGWLEPMKLERKKSV